MHAKYQEEKPESSQRWRRNIIVEIDEFETINLPQNDDTLFDFQVDVQSVNIYDNKDRFKKKLIHPKKQSQYEKITIQSMAQQQRKQQQTHQQNQIKDLWSEEGNQKNVLRTEARAFITPHPGIIIQSLIQRYIMNFWMMQQKQKLDRTRDYKMKRQKQRKAKKSEKKETQNMIEIQKFHRKEAIDRLIEKKS
ncbi:unnamed protein product [Paramecium octaurelia]|uniref:Uncharacterized protein n=1 Tax=Paramecium octaurelia TaxID=43137 RepID=A0A8S1SC40_PAROT|nr:unnamed protein product [Paramecium octaurelia]